MKFNIFTQNHCIDLVGSNWGYEILKPFFNQINILFEICHLPFFD
jgi:hypothetical protein